MASGRGITAPLDDSNKHHTLRIMSLVMLSLSAFYSILFFSNNQTSTAPKTTIYKYVIALTGIVTLLILTVFIVPTSKFLRAIEMLAAIGGVVIGGLAIHELLDGALANFDPNGTGSQGSFLDHSYCTFFVSLSLVASVIVLLASFYRK